MLFSVQFFGFWIRKAIQCVTTSMENSRTRRFTRKRSLSQERGFPEMENSVSGKEYSKIGFGTNMKKSCASRDVVLYTVSRVLDKEGHPVCYNIYGEFQNKEVYKKTFSDEGKRQNFLRWRIQFLEKSTRKLYLALI